MEKDEADLSHCRISSLRKKLSIKSHHILCMKTNKEQVSYVNVSRFQAYVSLYFTISLSVDSRLIHINAFSP